METRLVLAAVAVAAVTTLAGCVNGSDGNGSSGADASTSSPSPSPSPSPSEEPGLRYVAFGASWQYGAHCGMCTTFVSHYATYVEEETGLTVEFDDRSTNGGGTDSFLDTLRGDEDARAAVSEADIVVIGDGLNDLDSEGTLERASDGSCGSRCLQAMGSHWLRRYDAILEEIDALTAGRDVAVRLVGSQNVFLSDPAIIDDYGLPADFATGGGEVLTRELADAMATAAKRHDAGFVDVWRLFNGPDHDRRWDENSPEAHRAVARALVDTGLAPLDLG